MEMNVKHDPRTLQQSWHAVREQIAACQRQLSRCEQAEWRCSNQEDPEAVEELMTEREWLGRLIIGAHRRLLILLDQLALTVVLDEYRTGFLNHVKNVTQTYRPVDEPESNGSEALDYIRSFFSAATACLEPEKSARTIDALMQLRGILSATNFILERSGVQPQSETDVQRQVHEFLRIIYPDARREIPIPHVVKTFKADIGIASIEALIEIKFIDSQEEAKSNTPGLYEDMFGYRGDTTWKNYFAVVYCTGPYLRQEELEAEFALAKCPVDWTPIAVWGGGQRAKRGASNQLKGAVAKPGTKRVKTGKAIG